MALGGTRRHSLAARTTHLVSVAACVEAARIDDDRDGRVRVDAGTHRVKVELADRDAHAPAAEVAEPENAPAVCRSTTGGAQRSALISGGQRWSAVVSDARRCSEAIIRGC